MPSNMERSAVMRVSSRITRGYRPSIFADNQTRIHRKARQDLSRGKASVRLALSLTPQVVARWQAEKRSAYKWRVGSALYRTTRSDRAPLEHSYDESSYSLSLTILSFKPSSVLAHERSRAVSIKLELLLVFWSRVQVWQLIIFIVTTKWSVKKNAHIHGNRVIHLLNFCTRAAGSTRVMTAWGTVLRINHCTQSLVDLFTLVMTPRTSHNVPENLWKIRNVSELFKSHDKASDRLQILQNVRERLRTFSNLAEQLGNFRTPKKSQNMPECQGTVLNLQEPFRTTSNFQTLYKVLERLKYPKTS